MPELQAIDAAIAEAELNKISGISSLSRGGSSSSFQHMGEPALRRVKYDLALALHELDATEYAHPGNPSQKRMFI